MGELRTRYDALLKHEKLLIKDEIINNFGLTGDGVYQNVFRLINETRKLNKKEYNLISKIIKQYEE